MIPSSVLAFLRRAAPTVALLFGASALLILTDRQSAKRALPAIAVLQQTSSPVLEDTIKGMIAGLTERGFVDGKTVTIRRYNAEGDIAQGNAIAREIVGGPFDLVLANILANPLRGMATPMARHLAPSALVILSRLLPPQAQGVIAAYRARGLAEAGGYLVELRELWDGEQAVAFNQQSFAILA